MTNIAHEHQCFFADNIPKLSCIDTSLCMESGPLWFQGRVFHDCSQLVISVLSLFSPPDWQLLQHLSTQRRPLCCMSWTASMQLPTTIEPPCWSASTYRQPFTPSTTTCSSADSTTTSVSTTERQTGCTRTSPIGASSCGSASTHLTEHAPPIHA